MKRLALAALALMIASPSIAAPIPERGLVDHVERLLSCQSDPETVPLLTYLSQRGYISLASAIRADSSSCWKLVRPLNLGGLSVSGICAADEDPFIISLYPNMYWRGPGTSAGTLFSIATALPAVAVKAWAEKHNINPGYVDKSYSFDGMTAIECNSLNRSPSGPVSE